MIKKARDEALIFQSVKMKMFLWKEKRGCSGKKDYRVIHLF